MKPTISPSYIVPVEWADEPTVPGFSMSKPSVVKAVRPKFVGNANKKFCIIERKTRLVKFIGSMKDCQEKLRQAGPKYSMMLYRPTK